MRRQTLQAHNSEFDSMRALARIFLAALMYAAFLAALLAGAFLAHGAAGQGRGGFAHGFGDQFVAHGVILLLMQNHILSTIRFSTVRMRHPAHET
jgi:hypothetical protein